MASSGLNKAPPGTRSGRIVILVGISGLFVVVLWLTMKMLATPAALGALVVDEQHLSLGEVWEDPAFVRVLPIRNTTNDEIEITSFGMSCPCGRIEPSSIPVPGRGMAEVRLILNLTSPHKEPDLAGKDFEVTVLPQITKGAKSQAGWVVHGKVKQPFVFDPPVVDFEESLVRGQRFTPRSVGVTCGLDVSELTAHCDSPAFTTKVRREGTNPRRFRLEVQARADAPGGFFNHLVRLTALTPDKVEVPGAITVVGRVLEDVGLVPELLAFGAVPVGTRLHETVVVRSHSSGDFAVQEVDTGGVAGISVDVGEKRKDGSQPLAVSFVVERSGVQEYTIHVKVKAKGQQGLLDLPLLLSCHGSPVPKKEGER